MRIGSLRLGFVLLLGGVVAGLILLELVVRLALRMHAAPPRPDRPSYYYRYAGTRSYDNDVFELKKPAGVFRVVALGDSFTFPHLMQLDDVYPKRLERMLNLAKAPGLRAEVLNWGILGMNTVQELPHLRNALTAQPDLVLLQITLNDLQPGNFQELASTLKDRYTFGTLEISREKTPLYYYWRTLGLAAQQLHNIRTRESFVRFNLDLFANKKLWNDFRGAVTQMQNECRSRGVKFAVFVVPFFHFPLDEHYPFLPMHEKLGRWLDRMQVPHLDLLTNFRGMAPLGLQVLPNKDSHPNEIAHRIIAEGVYEWLEREALIPAELRIPERMEKRHFERVEDMNPLRALTAD